MKTEIVINSDNTFYLPGDRMLYVALDSISSDGEATFSGPVPDIQRLKPGQSFFIKSMEKEILISGTILKINRKQVYDVNSFEPDRQTITTMTIDAICSIGQCQYFEEMG